MGKYKFVRNELSIKDEEENICVKLFPPALEMPFKAGLYFEGKVIGVDLSPEYSVGGKKLTKWIIRDLFTAIWGRNKEGRVRIVGTAGRFSDKKKQSEAILMLSDCLSMCDLQNPTALKQMPVAIAPQLQQRIDGGVFI